MPRRALEVTGLVAVWMGLGFAFHLRPEAYLLLGIPLTGAFQMFVRRQPLRALWVREAPPFRLGRTGWIVAVGLASLPALSALASVAESDWLAAMFQSAVLLGALPTAYCLFNLDRAALRMLVACVAINVLMDVVFRSSLWLFHAHPVPRGLSATTIGAFLTAFAVLLTTMCVMEEVAFRGLLDSHIHQQGDFRGWASSAYLSALWGIWHLPILPQQGSFLGTILLLLGARVPFGIAMSFYWRRTGNLLVPGTAHAVLDALREAFFV